MRKKKTHKKDISKNVMTMGNFYISNAPIDV